MQFTPLEAILLSSFTAIVSGLAVRFFVGGRFVNKEECRKNHEHESEHNTQICSQIDELKTQQVDFQESTNQKLDVLFRMVRGLVVYSDMDRETKARILNE